MYQGTSPVSPHSWARESQDESEHEKETEEKEEASEGEDVGDEPTGARGKIYINWSLVRASARKPPELVLGFIDTNPKVGAF